MPALFAADALDAFLTEKSVAATGDAVAVGFSGGLDSTVLLHALLTLKQQRRFSIRALHVDHGIHPQSDRWSEHCAAICREWGVDLAIGRVQLADGAPGGLESAARLARYGWFKRTLEDSEVLFLAHHADDQLETLLYRLMRGAGPVGLRAMADDRLHQGTRILRPMLKFPRADLMQYAVEHGLRWQEDPANDDLAFDRVYLRRKVLPLLVDRWPSAPRQAHRSGQYLGELIEVAEHQTRHDMANATKPCFGGGTVFDTTALSALPRARLVQVFRLMTPTDGYAPSRSRLESLIALVRSQSRSGEVCAAGVVYRRYRDSLYVYLDPDYSKPPSEKSIPWQLKSSPIEFGAYQLSWNLVVGSGVPLAKLMADERVIVQRLEAGGASSNYRWRPLAQRKKIESKRRHSPVGAGFTAFARFG